MIEQILNEFLQWPGVERERLDTPAGADGMCVPATCGFLHMVTQQAPDLPVKCVEVLGHPLDPCFWHCIAKVGTTYYDFTLRQLDPEAEYPRVTGDLSDWAQSKEHDFPFEDEPFLLDG